MIIRKTTTRRKGEAGAVLMALLLMPTLAVAEGINQANTAWILTSTALVLFMTIPGLSLFYAGLVRSKNGDCSEFCVKVKNTWSMSS